MNIHTPPPTATSDTVTLQSDSGYFKKKTFYPSESAPSRRIEILRPWGAPGSPGAVEATATVANSDATVIDHTAMPQGWVRVWTHTLGGVQIEKLITASSTAIQTFPNTLLPAQEVTTETQVRYIGASTIPTTSVHQTVSVKADPRLSGRPLFSSKTDGSSEEYVYRFGTWNGTARTLVEDSGSDLSFMRTRVAGGRSDREIAVEDFSRLTFSRQQFRGVGGSLLPVSHDVHEYDPLHHLIKTQRETATGWRTIYEAAWIEDVQASETDETGIVTTFTHTDNDGIPDVETRAALPAANGLPAVPQRIRTRTWDAARVWQTETIKQGTTMLAQRAWRVDATGRILEETRNDALTTRYEYETGEGEALAVRRFERAAGAAQSTERLVSQTETDRLGRVVAITGPA